ncbi:MurR/RpiR family transcriptional regulator [Ruegeria atlantica]|uniref:MurR/RpiR family transcriptional regulator n=1 Tax=Ruegeria atlantica TaxID=81569 RepID=UPI001C2B8691|nr:MurR/RpiR family transcriptional regulator [Ruegeria atlantica]
MEPNKDDHMDGAHSTGILSRIRYMSAYLNPALRRIAEQVLKKPEKVKSMSIKELATICDVSESTVTRFVREIDVSSFQQFKILIAEELSQSQATETSGSDRHVYEDISETDDSKAIIDKVSARYAMTVQDTMAGSHSGQFEAAVAAIEEADTLSFFAMGSSMICVENALMRFMRVGKSCQFFRDLGVRQISTASLGPRNLAIGISNSGRTISTVDALKAAREQGARTLCITSFTDSPIVKYSDIKLFTPTVTGATGAADYHESMVSKIAQLQMIDILYSIYAVKNFGSAMEGLEKTSNVTSVTRY